MNLKCLLGFHENYGAEHRIALNIIKQLYPYFIVKKKQAERLLELEKLKKKPRREKGKKFQGTPYTKDYLEELEELWLQVKKLNNSKYLQNAGYISPGGDANE